MVKPAPGEHPCRRRARRRAELGSAAGSADLRRLDLLGLGSGALLLTVLTVLTILAATPSSLPYLLAALGVLVLWMGIALRLRHRFWVTLEGELEGRRTAELTARAADRAKGRFLAQVSHEIRTPMHGILAMIGLLLRSELTAQQREQAELVRTSARTLLGLVEDVLDLSRIEAERLRLRPRDFVVEELVDEVLRLLAPRAARREVELEHEIAPSLPHSLHGDAARLRQVLLNLVGNAVRFTRRGSVAVSVERAAGVAAEGGPVPVRFVVRDTGTGIRPEDQARLFQPFIQVGSSGSGIRTGSGLGLVISKNLVEVMGGEIGFESTRGMGSTFWFTVPLERAGAGGVVDPAPLWNAGEEARRRTRGDRRILVVDDRGVNRAVALALLTDLGYAAEAADGGEEALAMLRGGRFDAVLLDCDMPGVDGFETCSRLRRWEATAHPGRRLPVIAVTAHTRPEDTERCLAAGMDGHLGKPFRTAELVALLDRRLGIGEDEIPPVESAVDDLAVRLAALKRRDEVTGESTVATFLRRGEADLVSLRRALPRADREAATAASHALAGSAGVLGASDLADRATEIAVLARRGDLDGCTHRLAALERAWQRTVERLHT